MPFTPAEVSELKQKLGLNNPSRFFNRDFFKFLGRNSNGVKDFAEVWHGPFQSVPAGTWAQMNMDEVVHDNNNLWDMANKWFKIKDEGLYMVENWINWSDPITTNGERLMRIYSDPGFTVDTTQKVDLSANVDQHSFLTFGFCYAGDVIRILAFNSDSAAKDAGSWARIVRIA